jgi:uncharacterized protein YecE (DUF72 family)
MPRVFVGISGWRYTPWRGNFFPGTLPQRLELAYAARRFNALEVNGTFYSLQRPELFAAWHDDSPPGFVFALKGARFITHMKKLRDCETPLANFFASGPLRLRDKLGPVLWQFPPHLGFDEERFRRFFEMLPRDTLEAARLARRHDSRMKGRSCLDADACRPVRHAVEFRHDSFLTESFVALLREHGIAMVVADVAGRFPVAHDVTSDWVYVRLHGARRLYVSGYMPREIETWAQRVEAWRAGGEPADALRISRPARPAPRGRDVYVFFDNTDVKLRAPVDARRMAQRLGVAPPGTPRQVMRALGVPPAAAAPPRVSRTSGRTRG